MNSYRLSQRFLEQINDAPTFTFGGATHSLSEDGVPLVGFPLLRQTQASSSRQYPRTLPPQCYCGRCQPGWFHNGWVCWRNPNVATLLPDAGWSQQPGYTQYPGYIPSDDSDCVSEEATVGDMIPFAIHGHGLNYQYFVNPATGHTEDIDGVHSNDSLTADSHELALEEPLLQHSETDSTPTAETDSDDSSDDEPTTETTTGLGSTTTTTHDV